jgi:hypothetical protein
LVKIRLHTKNQLPRLPGSALKVPGWWWGGVASYPLLSQAPTPVEVELGCDKNLGRQKLKRAIRMSTTPLSAWNFTIELPRGQFYYLIQ